MNIEFHTSIFRGILQVKGLNKINWKFIQNFLRPLQNDIDSVRNVNKIHWNLDPPFLILSYIGDIASPSETKGHRADGFWHEPHGDLIPTIPHCLNGLADVPVVMGHADVL